MADMPLYLSEAASTLFKERLELLAENAKLKQQQIRLQAQNQKLLSLEAENQELRDLFRSVGSDKDAFFEARIIQADLDPFSHQVIVNKGSRQGAAVGQPVIDAQGVVGMVQSVDLYTSRVLLVTDTGLSIPVQSVRTGERAIVTGSGTGGELRLSYVSRTADFKQGDQLVTSGLGGRYPAGYAVGTVTAIRQDPSTRFLVVTLSPSAKLGQMRYVLLIKQPRVSA